MCLCLSSSNTVANVESQHTFLYIPPSSKMEKVKNFRKICWEGLENVDFGGSNLEEEKKEGGNFADHEELRTFEKVIQNCILEV